MKKNEDLILILLIGLFACFAVAYVNASDLAGARAELIQAQDALSLTQAELDSCAGGKP